MAKVYKAPKGYEPPEFIAAKSWKEHQKHEQEYIERLREWCRTRPQRAVEKDRDLLGTILSFPVADGYAQYMVCGVDRVMEVIHLEIGDAWRAHSLIEKGMDKHEARQHKKREDNPIFGKKENA